LAGGRQLESLARTDAGVSVEIRERGSALCFAVRVQPRASREGYAGEWNGALKIRLAAAPVDNRANDDLCRLLAESLNVPRAAVRITARAHSRTKKMEVLGVSPAQVLALAASSG